jgi:hypothetical protein
MRLTLPFLHTVLCGWLLRREHPACQRFGCRPLVKDWMTRMKAIGHHHVSQLTAREALEICQTIYAR